MSPFAKLLHAITDVLLSGFAATATIGAKLVVKALGAPYAESLRATPKTELGLPKRLLRAAVIVARANSAYLVKDFLTRTVLKTFEPQSTPPNSPLSPSPKLLVICHVYYLEQCAQILVYLRHLSAHPFDFVVTTPHDSAQAKIRTDFAEFGAKIRFFVTPNRGRDIGPFVHALQNLDLKDYDLVCKLHTKKSDYLPNKSNKDWATELLESVLGSPAQVETILRAFQSNRHINQIGAPGYFCNDIGSNRRHVDFLSSALELRRQESPAFVGGTIFWMRASALQKLQSLPLEFATDRGARDGKLEHAVERIFGALATENGVIAAPPTEFIKAKELIKPVCCYLPQFHAIPENDKWWGPGFTEWTNVGKAQSLYAGHKVQLPHPDIGEYLILSRETRARQAEIARRYGVHGFVFYHYWFGSKKLLEKPAQLMLEDGEPNIPFCFTWANENWTRSWDGLTREILMKQEYGDRADWIAHLDYLFTFFRHHNYIKIDGKPVFNIYRVGNIQKLPEMIAVWQEHAIKNGFPGLVINAVLGNFEDSNVQAFTSFKSSLDNFITFEPNFIKRFVSDPGSTTTFNIKDAPTNWRAIEGLRSLGSNHLRGTFPNWDNSPRRREHGTIFAGSTPEGFRSHLQSLFERYSLEIASTPHHSGLLFINAWNEWAEGAVMEPSQQYGYAYLEALAAALETPLPKCAHIAL